MTGGLGGSGKEFFADVADAVRGFLPRELGECSVAISGRNVKLWFDDAKEHYEAQRTRRGFEVGFHSEHGEQDRNEVVLSRLQAGERAWRKALGKQPQAGPFLGSDGPWRRISEFWDEVDLEFPDAAVEVADRLGSYIEALEPLRRQASR